MVDFAHHIKVYGETEVRIELMPLAGLSSFDSYMDEIRSMLADLEADGLARVRAPGLPDPYLWVGAEMSRDRPFAKASAAFREAGEATKIRVAKEAEQRQEAGRLEAQYRATRTPRVRIKEVIRRLWGFRRGSPRHNEWL